MGDPKGLSGEAAAPREGFSWLSSTGTSSLRAAGC